jgi:hypothetical protein
MMDKDAAAHFVKDKTPRDLAESLLRGANAPEVVGSLMLVIEAYGERCAAQERARYEPAMRSFVATWEDGTVIDSSVLRRFVRLFRDALR